VQNSKAGMLRQLWRSETCLPGRVVGFWCPAPSVLGQASLPAPWDPCRAFVMPEHWSGREHRLILRSRRIAVLILKYAIFFVSPRSHFCATHGENCGA